MTTDPKGTVALLKRLNTLAKSLTVNSGFAEENARTQFVQTSEQLAIAARYPDENIFFAVTRITQNAAIRVACSLNIFAVIPAASAKM